MLIVRATTQITSSDLETWKSALDNDLFTATVLMGLSKVFDGIPQDLLIAIFQSNKDTVTFLNGYLKVRQTVKINNACSMFLTIPFGTPQKSILGPILFNTFLRPTRVKMSIVIFAVKTSFGTP